VTDVDVMCWPLAWGVQAAWRYWLMSPLGTVALVHRRVGR
jgi:hypothetical protein